VTSTPAPTAARTPSSPPTPSRTASATPRRSAPAAPPPADVPETDLVATWIGVGSAQVGDTVEQVEALLGARFTDRTRYTDDCFVAVDDLGRFGVIATEPGGVQAFLIGIPGVPMVSGATVPVGVGDTLQDVQHAFPDWFSLSDHTGQAGGPRVLVAPGAYPRRAVLFEADPDGVVQQFRVGDATYVDHVDYCTTPD